MPVFQQSILIQASASAVEACWCDRDLMHRWLNPALRCDPIGPWGTAVGDRSRFVLQLPAVARRFEPALQNIVLEREPGKIVWGFEGFFVGQDTWECQPELAMTDPRANPTADPTADPRADQTIAQTTAQPTVQTRLLNRFEFTIPHPVVRWGFNLVAADWVRADMQAQLRRFKRVAEALYLDTADRPLRPC